MTGPEYVKERSNTRRKKKAYGRSVKRQGQVHRDWISHKKSVTKERQNARDMKESDGRFCEEVEEVLVKPHYLPPTFEQFVRFIVNYIQAIVSMPKPTEHSDPDSHIAYIPSCRKQYIVNIVVNADEYLQHMVQHTDVDHVKCLGDLFKSDQVDAWNKHSSILTQVAWEKIYPDYPQECHTYLQNLQNFYEIHEDAYMIHRIIAEVMEIPASSDDSDESLAMSDETRSLPDDET